MKLPSILYARIEKDRDESYIIANGSLDEAVNESGVTTIGVYKLQSVKKYRRVSELVKKG